MRGKVLYSSAEGIFGSKLHLLLKAFLFLEEKKVILFLQMRE